MFFCKQKTAYEMRISDWSSDVCSSDLSGFEKHGITMTPYCNEWGRQGAFIHTVNHTRVNCIRDVAKALLAESGMRPIDSCVLPHDNLLNSAMFPVYPEIGEVYGVSGSYNFKINGEYRFMTLEQMIED